MTDTIAPASTTPNPGDASPAATQTTAPVDATVAPVEASAQATPVAAETPAPPVVPEKYEFKSPENIKLDDGVISEFSTVAKELGLTQDAAQILIDKLAPKMAERDAARYADAAQAYRNELTNQAKIDKEFGGDKLDENISIAKKALDAFGTPELLTLLNESGLGNHPEIIRAFYRAGKAINPDNVVVKGGNQPPKGSDLATKLYG